MAHHLSLARRHQIVGATTVGVLEDTTGIDRSTLYKSFGGKDGLYASAADAYIAMATEQLFSVLHDGDAGVADILAFIDTLAASHRAAWGLANPG